MGKSRPMEIARRTLQLISTGPSCLLATPRRLPPNRGRGVGKREYKSSFYFGLNTWDCRQCRVDGEDLGVIL